MSRLLSTILAAFFVACAASTGRDPLLVATEQRERLKPQLSPAGGNYYGAITVNVVNFRNGLEIVDGPVASPLQTAALSVTESGTLTIRDLSDPGLSSTEKYTIVSELSAPKILPPAGEYTGSVLVTAITDIRNARIEFSTTAGASGTYDPETGIILAQSCELSLRLCARESCGPWLKANYSIVQQRAAEQAVATSDNARLLATLAQSDYNQKTSAGLAARMDEAKLRVIADGSLLSDASLRSRFLAQHNESAAANACTTIARYLYVLARRMSESRLSYTVLPDFADYYIRHIRSGDIAQDNEGNFVWIVNGANLVTPYLAVEQLHAFEYQRGGDYPTDFSLLQPIYSNKPAAALLRDGAGATVGTHTFAAVHTEAGFIMLDTYFAPWNSLEARSTAGLAWPYGYRFGPYGSRFLHYTYGY